MPANIFRMRKGKCRMDIKHYFVEKGRGEPIIFLHGNGENCGYFRGQMDAFAKFYHVYAIDTRGHGKTPRGVMPFTIRQFADDLLGFMVFAIRYPDRVDRLILNGANMRAEGVKRSVQIPIEIEYKIVKRLSGKNDAAKRKAEMLGLMVNDPNVSTEELAGIRAKTLVIAGTGDMIRTEHTREIAAGIPDAELKFIKGDHFIAGKCPEEFNRSVLNFLRS